MQKEEGETTKKTWKEEPERGEHVKGYKVKKREDEGGNDQWY